MSFPQFALPVLTVNGYLWDTMKSIDPSLSLKKNYGTSLPFFPMSDSASGASSWENKPYFIYDRMFRITGSPFPYIKKEHIIYSLKGKEEQTLEWGNALQYILDRQDDSAQDINEWNSNQTVPNEVYFHSTRVLQTNPSMSRDFSNRPFYVTEFIIEAQYHLTNIEQVLS
jgi:hypothetical protein